MASSQGLGDLCCPKQAWEGSQGPHHKEIPVLISLKTGFYLENNEKPSKAMRQGSDVITLGREKERCQGSLDNYFFAWYRHLPAQMSFSW